MSGQKMMLVGVMAFFTAFTDAVVHASNIILHSITPTNKREEAQFQYNRHITLTPDLTREKLEPSHPLYTDEAGMEDRILGVFDISGKADNYYVVFSTGPSWDLSYCFYAQSRIDSNEATDPFGHHCDFEIYAPNVTITNDGWLYSSGHNNNLADEKRAFRFSNGKLIEIEQPLHYIGKKSVSKRAQQLYSDELLLNPSITLGENEPVTIIATKRQKEGFHAYLLVANQRGISGWILADGHQVDNQFEGIYFAGD